jgi:hypothetical protein
MRYWLVYIFELKVKNIATNEKEINDIRDYN